MPSLLVNQQVLNQAFDDDNDVWRIDIRPTVPQAYQMLATGADTYTDVVTATAERHHLAVYNVGVFPAVVSLDGGTTDHFVLPGNSASIFDAVLIPAAQKVSVKNAVAGSDCANIYITIW